MSTPANQSFENNAATNTLINAVNTALTFQHQAPAVISVNAVQNTWYTILDTTLNVRLIGVMLRIQTTSESIQFKITIDGVLAGASGSLTNDTLYYIAIDGDMEAIAGLIFATGALTNRSFLLEGRSIKVEARKVTANGTGNFQVWLDWAKR